MKGPTPALLKGLQATSLWMCNLVSHQVTITSYSNHRREERCMGISQGPSHISMVFGLVS